MVLQYAFNVPVIALINSAVKCQLPDYQCCNLETGSGNQKNDLNVGFNNIFRF